MAFYIYTQSKKLKTLLLVILATFHVPRSHGELGALVWNSEDLECFCPQEKSSPRLVGSHHGGQVSVQAWGWEDGKQGGRRELAGVWGLFSRWPWLLQES